MNTVDLDLPTRNQFLRWYSGYCVPERIQKHCVKVADVGEVLSFGSKLVDRLCLVHDAFKTASLNTRGFVTDNNGEFVMPTLKEIKGRSYLKKYYGGLHEVEVAARIMEKKGYKDFARYVRQIGSTANPVYLDADMDVKIAHYADWRVLGDVIVPFEERLEYLRDHYYKGIGWDERVERELKLEEEIFKDLNFGPDDLAGVVNSSKN